MFFIGGLRFRHIKIPTECAFTTLLGLSVSRVICGLRHTLIQTGEGLLFGCGDSSFGQVRLVVALMFLFFTSSLQVGLGQHGEKRITHDPTQIAVSKEVVLRFARLTVGCYAGQSARAESCQSSCRI